MIVSRSGLAATLILIVATDARGQSASPRVIELAPPTAALPAEFTVVTSVRELSDGRLLIVDGSERTLSVAADANRGAAEPAV